MWLKPHEWLPNIRGALNSTLTVLKQNKNHFEVTSHIPLHRWCMMTSLMMKGFVVVQLGFWLVGWL